MSFTFPCENHVHDKHMALIFDVAMVPGGFRVSAGEASRGVLSACPEPVATCNLAKRDGVAALMVQRLNEWLEHHFPEQAPSATLMVKR